MARRHVAEQVGGGSSSHAHDCKLFASQLIVKGQQTGLANFLLEAQASNRQIKFALSNMIFDELELEATLAAYGQGAWSILASHAQISFRVGNQTNYFDSIALPNKQACTMWPALCAGDGFVHCACTSPCCFGHLRRCTGQH